MNHPVEHRGRWKAIGLAAVMFAAPLAASEAAAAPTVLQTPEVVPALQEWTPDDGPATYRFKTPARIVVAPDSYVALADTVELFAADLHAVTGVTVPVTIGVNRPPHTRPGDLHLSLSANDADLGDEGYRLVVGPRLTIEAPSTTGVFYGTRSVLQMLNQDLTIPMGTARDRSDYRERSLMVDVARQFYTIDWLYDRVRQLSYYKYNTLHLHLTDDQAFRLESERHPDIVSEQHYTKEEIRGLVEFAARHHITVIPELDMPGHMTQILDVYPDLRLVGANGEIKRAAMDLSKPAAYELARDLIEEYLPLFPGQYWHLGADEWLREAELSNFPDLAAYARAEFGPTARARDTYYHFINWANDLVKAHGKTLRIWNDQLVSGYLINVDPDVVVEHWYGSTFMTVQQVHSRGHEIVNANWHQLYYIIGISRPDAAEIYETFTPDVFPIDPSGTTTIPADSPQLRGTQLSLWGEPGAFESEGSVAGHLRAPLAALSQATWGSPKLVSSYVAFVSLVKRVGLAPGYTGVDEPWDVPPTPTSSLPNEPGQLLEYVVDDDTSTYFRSSRSVRAHDHVTLDLNGVKRLTQINLLLGAPDQAGETFQYAVLETSLDGSSWQTHGSIDGQASVEAFLPARTLAQYVRIRAVRNQRAPVAIREFTATGPVSAAGPISSSLPTYLDNTIDNAADGDLATYFWSSRGPRADDYLLLDLGGVQQISNVNLYMSEPGGRPGDYIRQGVLETSPDGIAWEALGTFADQPEITVETDRSARYVRFRVTANQGDWAIVREFAVR